MTYCTVNGNLFDLTKATVSISDLALQRGYGIFEYFKILNERPIFLEDHLDRFYRSAVNMRLAVGYSREAVRGMIHELIEINDLPDSGIKLLLTGGNSADGFKTGQPNLVITHNPLPTYGVFQSKGIKVITHRHQRQMPEIKTIDYLMAVWLQPFIEERKAQDVIYHDGQLISECPRSNIFIVTKDDRIVTPAKNVLKGIIRSQILKLEDKFPIIEAGITLQDLFEAKEIFITSTTKNILPVIQVDDKLVSNGEPGPVTIRLTSKLEAVINEFQHTVF
ncbi:MAG: amino acid aminotransferase [Chitinophagaceae bacterium]|nr:MAG: amino acid aminotransferase [Chitinophagaceae bacterium]